MAIKRKTLNYSVRVILDAGTNEYAKAKGYTFGNVSHIGGPIDVDYYNAHNGDDLLIALISDLENFYENPVAAVNLTATYGLEKS